MTDPVTWMALLRSIRMRTSFDVTSRSSGFGASSRANRSSLYSSPEQPPARMRSRTPGCIPDRAADSLMYAAAASLMLTSPASRPAACAARAVRARSRAAAFFSSSVTGRTAAGSAIAHHFHHEPSFVAHLLGAPSRLPHPADVDPCDAVERFDCGTAVAEDLFGQRAAHRRQGHLEPDEPLIGYVDPVEQPEVDHVDPQLRILDLLHCAAHIIFGRHLPSCWFTMWVSSPSLSAIHDSNAHLIRTGYFATPSSAMASPSWSS